MKKWRYLMLGGAALSWAGCADLPSFPEGLGQAGAGGSGTQNNTGGGSVVPNAGTGTMPNAGTNSTAGTAGSSTGGSGGAPSTTGGSGGSDAAGTSSGGSNATAGTGGMMTNPQAEVDEAVKALKGWRYENPCGYVDGHSLTDGTCNSGEICFPDSNKARFAEKKVIQIGGVSGHQYDVTLRIRGAIEPRDYPADCTFLPGGSPNGATVSVIENCDGFANSGQVSFNVFELKIQQPAHTYYLNAVKTHPPHRVDAMDQNFTVRLAAGTKIDFAFDDLNGGEIRNCSVTVEGIQPYPKVYDGNFFQLDVVDAKLVP
jgi:hypothetical protein